MRTRKIHLLSALAVTVFAVSAYGCTEQGSTPVSSSESSTAQTTDSTTPDSSSSSSSVDSSTSSSIDSSTSSSIDSSTSSSVDSSIDSSVDSSTDSSVDTSSDSTVPGSDSSSSSEGGEGGDPSIPEHPDTIDQETDPSDLNIYFYSESLAEAEERSYMWAWDDSGVNYLFKASRIGEVTTDDESLSEHLFVTAFYITLDHDYTVFSDWEGTAESTLNLKADFTNLFAGLLLRDESHTTQSNNFYLDESQIVRKDDGGAYDIYLWENYTDTYGITENVTLYSSSEFLAAYDNKLEGEVIISDKTIHDNTEPGDLNIYFYEMNGLGIEYRDWLYVFDDYGSDLFQMSGDTAVTLEEIGSDHAFLPWYINLGATYAVYDDWDITDLESANQHNIRFNSVTDLGTLIFRSDENLDNGGQSVSQTDNIELDLYQLVAEEDGTYNIFVVETTEGNNWVRNVYYGIDAFNEAGLAGNVTESE